MQPERRTDEAKLEEKQRKIWTGWELIPFQFIFVRFLECFWRMRARPGCVHRCRSNKWRVNLVLLENCMSFCCMIRYLTHTTFSDLVFHWKAWTSLLWGLCKAPALWKLLTLSWLDLPTKWLNLPSHVMGIPLPSHRSCVCHIIICIWATISGVHSFTTPVQIAQISDQYLA